MVTLNIRSSAFSAFNGVASSLETGYHEQYFTRPVTTRFSGFEVVYNEYCTYDVLYISVMFI